MFENAKVGDRVWSVRNGWGTIIDTNDLYPYPLVVEFGRRTEATFTIDGRYLEEDLYPSLFWDEIKIIPPPRPKRKVKKVVNATLSIRKDGSIYAYSSHEQVCEDISGRIALVKVTGEYEVEE